MDVRWDPAKAKANLRKHGIHFSDAEAVLFDPLALSMEDQDAEGEDRYIAMGEDTVGRVLVVVYTYRGDTIRIISARLATRKEMNVYEKGI
ncbi:BrnT family toxin [Thiohalophilus sp.]|uniref:BrnT family toxin n=1 Tax=Thiohalophilus sp. TaxID=3028392 RepID=UPI002ACE8432|nr:BrnT family toxin [Thiohalophilus sp.]MDZ7661472.1 BrnT family toxin [Thiohalophilus sp.]